jgi:hypothetical protein
VTAAQFDLRTATADLQERLNAKVAHAEALKAILEMPALKAVADKPKRTRKPQRENSGTEPLGMVR